MRYDIAVWAAARPPLKDLEKVLARACNASLLRDIAIITPLFHASPKYRLAAPAAQRLRLITLENGDFNQIHNPADPNFDEIFIEWPRVIVHYKLQPLGFGAESGAREALFECNDFETNWERAGWTSGTTETDPGERKARHKFVFGLSPFGWTTPEEMEETLTRVGTALAQTLSGTWEFVELPGGGGLERLRAYFVERKNPLPAEEDPTGGLIRLDDADIGRI